MSKHSVQRLQERYNLELNENDNKYLLGMINSGQFFPLLNGDKKEKRAYIKYKQIPLNIVYAVNKNNYAVEIVTALPFNTDEYNQLLEQENQKNINNCIMFLKKNGYIVYKKKIKTRC